MAKGNRESKGRFEKGMSGNIHGRPVGVKSLTQTLKDMMDATEINLEVKINVPGKDPEIRTYSINADHSMKYAVSLAMITQAIQGNISAINSIFDRIEGRIETRDPKEKKSEFPTLTNEEKRKKIIELFPRVA